jgi:3-oxoadipate enol-lactonase
MSEPNDLKSHSFREPATTYIAGVPRLAVSEAGSGELVLFLHGIGGNRSNWWPQLDEFSARFRTVALDARGYGDSDDYEGDVSIADFAGDVLRVLDHFGAERAHLVGLSLGGRIAQRVALEHPERVSSLTLADTRPDTRDTRSPAEREAFLTSRARPLEAGGTPRDIAPSVARSLAAPGVRNDVLQELIESISSLRAGSYLKTIAANLNDDFVGDLANISAPTLLLVGEHDTLTPVRLSAEMANAIPAATLRIIPNSGHLSNLENSPFFNHCLGDFLERHASA